MDHDAALSEPISCIRNSLFAGLACPKRVMPVVSLAATVAGNLPETATCRALEDTRGGKHWMAGQADDGPHAGRNAKPASKLKLTGDFVGSAVEDSHLTDHGAVALKGAKGAIKVTGSFVSTDNASHA